MMRMVAAINGEHLAKLGFGHGNTVQVSCITCHRGQDRPLTLGQRLMDTIESGGVQAGVEDYQRLCEQDYGRGKFDFGEGSLNALGYRRLFGGRTIDAIVIIELNVAQCPDAANPHDSLGEAYMQAGRRAEAIASYRRSLVLNPDNNNAEDRLRALNAGE
ncbi:MAG: tetratricopeptide repeat protein [Candidatus Marinimicrobia bacterium]|nr:tetratricopeptide repeat protein [Candidatus Neomarinimicrobiota bacterium]